MMAKRENDLSERTLAETIDGPRDRFGAADLGKRSKVTRAKREPAEHAEAAAPSMQDALRSAFLAQINTDLHARDRKGRALPTLQERIAREGFRAQLGKKPAVQPSGKTRKARKVKRA